MQSSETPSLGPSISGGVCEVCEQRVQTRTCPQCNGAAFCNGCWGTQLAHKPRRVVEGLPHEKIISEVYHRLQGVFRQDRTSDEQHDLHVSDIDTTWSGVVKDELPGSKPFLRHENRFMEIMRESQTGKYAERFPQLVSFVGHTGAGKSTIIKLLISRAEATIRSQRQEFHVPVTGLSNDNISTTGDVHLYSDPTTYWNQTPLLYADCEGLSGGENVPLGTVTKQKVATAKAAKSIRSNRVRKTVDATVATGRMLKRLAWADSSRTQSRQHSVKELYPRILYTFSDVIVFVLRESRTFQTEVLPLLVEWARSSIDKSINQPTLPHIVVALNATDNMVDANQWDTNFATTKLLEDVRESVNQVPDLQRTVEQLRYDGTAISTTKELLEFYYSSINVIRVPAKGSYQQIEEQVGKLYDAIRTNCAVNYHRKRSARMVLSAERMQQYINSAFDHFSHFSGHMVNLMLSLYHDMPDERQPRNPDDLLKGLSRPIACCLMLAAAREDMQGQYKTLLEHVFSDPIKDAFLEFRTMRVRCGFQKDGSACCNVQSSHDKGHQAQSGKILGKGPYISPSVEELSYKEWITDISKHLDQLNSRANRNGYNTTDGGDMTERDSVSKLDREESRNFYQQFSSPVFTPKLVSNATCFACIRNIPEHVLPCAHALCRSCVQSFGEQVGGSRPGGSGIFELHRCPLLHPGGRSWEGQPVRIRFKPRDAGVRVLCLDGGGIRGIVELTILHAIEKELGGFMSVQDCFDLIVGTSSGGIVALGLGVKNWTVSDCMTKFKQLSTKAFSQRPLKHIALVSHKSYHKTKPLEEALKLAFDKDSALFGGQFQAHGEKSDIKVAVTSTSAVENRPVIMTNYNTAIARATSAAPLYFKSYVKPETGIGYTDGAIHYNCPVWVADHEWRLLWNDVRDWSPDIMLSLGTGLGPISEKTVKNEERTAEKMHQKRSKTSGIRYMWRTAFGIIDSQINCEKEWRDYYEKSQLHQTHEGQPNLDEIAKLQATEEHAVQSLIDNTDIKEVAHRLVASCFYFEQNRGLPYNRQNIGYSVQGNIRCRFEEGSPKLKAMGKVLKNFLTGDFKPYFLVQENYGTESEMSYKYLMETTTILKMCDTGIFDLQQPIDIHTAAKSNLTRISLCLEDKAYYKDFSHDRHLSISGFPREILEDPAMKPLPAIPNEGEDLHELSSGAAANVSDAAARGRRTATGGGQDIKGGSRRAGSLPGRSYTQPFVTSEDGSTPSSRSVSPSRSHTMKVSSVTP
ncbi:hypothetical protein QBC37DRAFT_438226 [Rhypophila decipiens]|uniref:PNPLA domain-containing protein n=1 Tax=Rhypophila decipiens TaxID=261697 RepID=A0AAN6YEN9_9PEZI|nr:hypothetical protein QBC37DRAFT_438226 [Rhypophila decipiens]